MCWASPPALSASCKPYPYPYTAAQLLSLSLAAPAVPAAQVLDVTPTIHDWVPRPKPSSPVLALQPSDLSLLAAMPALRLLCVPLQREMFQLEEGNPVQQLACAQQLLLFTAFCALLPHLAVVPSGAASLPGLFQGLAIEGGLCPAKQRAVRDNFQLAWADTRHDMQDMHWMALALLRQAADEQQLSPQAAALVASYSADSVKPSS